MGIIEDEVATVMDNSIAARLRSWGALSTCLVVGLLAAFLLAGAGATGSVEAHALLEAIATLLALFAGLIAFIHYYTGHNSRFLFIGSGFVAAAILDAYHTVATSGWFGAISPSPPHSVTGWSWYPSRLLLAALLLVGWRAWRYEEQQGEEPGWQKWLLFVIVAVMTIVSFGLFAFARLPDAYWDGGWIGRPHELLPGLLFLIALAGYWRLGRWRQEPFERWIIAFLILSVAVQFPFMSLSRAIFDGWFMASHFLKILSYASILAGLLLNMHRVFMIAQKNTQAVAVLNQELEQRVAQRTKALRESEARFRGLSQQFGVLADLGLRALSNEPLPELLVEVVNSVASLLEVEFCKILELQPDGDSLLLRAGVGWSDAYAAGEAVISSSSDSQSGFTLTTDEAVIVRDMASDARFKASSLLRDHGVVSGMSVIIQGRERPYGVFGVHTAQRREFDQDEVNFVQAVANVLAAAIEQREAERMLAERNHILNSILDSMDEGIIVAREDGSFAFFNRAAGELLGAGPVDSGPEGWTAIYHLYDPQKMVPMPTEELPLVRALQGATVEDMDLYVQNPHYEDGLLLNVSTQPFFDENGEQQGALAVFSDITAQRRAEKAIRQLNVELEARVQQRTEQLQAANEELEAFAYSVSHDLRTPLRAMDGFSRILLDEFEEDLPPPALRYLRRIRFNAQQMGALIDDLLAFSRLSRQPLKTQPVQPVSLVRQAYDSLIEQQEGRQIEIEIRPLPAVEADPRLLKAVFTNLLANAMKYTRARQMARIEVGAQQESGDPDHWPVFYVRDNGVGFDMKYAGKLFGVFQRLHKAEDYEGTGVGLAIVHRIVQRHGGRIWAEAEIDKGATFFFTIGEAIS